MFRFIRERPILFGIGLLVLFVVFGVNIATFYTDWLWFGEVGYRDVFGKILGTRALLFVIFGLASFLLAYVNLRLAERFSPSLGIRIPGESPDGGDVFIFDRDGRPRRATANGRVVNTLAGVRRFLAGLLLLGALAFAVIAGLSAASQWDSFLRFRNATPFGATDPLFHKDIGFYVFTLPFLGYVQSWFLVVVLMVGAAVALLYFFQRGIDTMAGRTVVAPHVRGHLSALAALALLIQAVGYWLRRYDLLYASGSTFPGAGYTDIHARLPALNILAVIAVLAAIAVLVNLWRRSIPLLAIPLALWLIAAFGIGVLYPGAIQTTVVRPNEARREAPYIARAIEATRAAYDLNRIEVRDFPATTELTRADLARNRTTLNNIRLWDYDPLLETYPQQQGLRQYYAFHDVDVDRYRLGGEAGYRQVWLAVRDIAPDRLDARAQTWPNLHLRYTHGYGVVMSPVNEFTGEGMPTFFLRDIPLVSTVPGLRINEPRIYYGQETQRGTYVVVGTQQKEFDYPSNAQAGGGEVENTYTGRGGIRLSPLAKFAFSWRFRDPTLLLSRELTSESRLLFARSVSTRVARVAPFLELDADPYPAVADGRIQWIQDAYTVTSAYPYSAPLGVQNARNMDLRFNYIRNAVKAVVDAYDGTVTLYANDEDDPILKTYRRIFPGTIKPLAEMPAGLKAHRRYPEDLFAVQRRILADYHVTDPGKLYDRTDSWEVARERRSVEASETTPATEAQTAAISPYYVIMRLPEERDEEFLLLSPFTPRGKQNMIAWLAARSDGDRYGQLVLYQFPANGNVYGPEQIGLRILQDQRISAQLALWDQRGSRVLLGNMLVIPIERSLLYVQPLYLKAQTEQTIEGRRGPSIPELKQVIVAFGNRIAMAGTLEEALSTLFGQGARVTGQPADRPDGPRTGSAATMETLAAEAQAQYERADRALRQGNLEEFGREYRALGETMRRLQSLRSASPTNAPKGAGR